MSSITELSSKLERLRRDCDQLETHKQLSLAEFLIDVSARDEVCYFLFTTYRNAREIGTSLIGLRGLPQPRDDTDIFGFLGEQDVLSDTCVAQLNAMEGLCTSLSKHYDDIDPQYVYQALQINLAGLYQFVDQIQSYLDQ